MGAFGGHEAIAGSTVTAAEEEFSAFVRASELRLRQALAARFGPDLAHDAAAEGLVHAWLHWDRVRTMENPIGYVYAVARSRGRSRRKAPRPDVAAPDRGMPDVEPGLLSALGDLSERQRVAVLLVHGWGWTHQEVAELMGVSASTVRNHLSRGLDSLRSRLGVRVDD